MISKNLPDSNRVFEISTAALHQRFKLEIAIMRKLIRLITQSRRGIKFTTLDRLSF